MTRQPELRAGQIWQALPWRGSGHERLVRIEHTDHADVAIRTVVRHGIEWTPKPGTRQTVALKERFDGSYWGYRYVCDGDFHGDLIVEGGNVKPASAPIAKS
jgi:hypothetical protein